MPAAYTGRIVTQFRGCLHDRLVAADPTVTPGGLPAPGGPAGAARRRAPGAGPRGRRRGARDDFAASVERTLWFQVGVFVLSFLLMLLLPRGAGRHRPGSGEAAPGAAG